MGGLISSVREAEERLAAIARTLQSAYDEELSRAQAAGESASRGLRHARALEQAAQELGRAELAERLREVSAQFQEAELAARTRLEELAHIESTITTRLNESGPESNAFPALPVRERTAVPPAEDPTSDSSGPSESSERSKETGTSGSPEWSEQGGPEGRDSSSDSRSSAHSHDDDDTDSPASAQQEPTPEVLDLLNRVKQLEPRVDQVARVAPRAPREELLLAVQEHVALARLLQDRLQLAGWDGATALAYSLDSLRHITADQQLEGVVGLDQDERAEWNRVAAEARAKRQVLAEERKRGPYS